jgi:hypothetical protein
MKHLRESLEHAKEYINRIRNELFPIVNSLTENNERTRTIMNHIHNNIKVMAQNNNFNSHDFNNLVSLCKNESLLAIKNRKDFKDCWLNSSYVVFASYDLGEKAMLIANYYRTIRRIKSINDINTYFKMLQDLYEKIFAKMKHMEEHVVPGLRKHALRLESENIASLNNLEKQLAYGKAA